MVSEQDLKNAALRAEIAERQQAEYNRVLLWSVSVFGQGWKPSHRHFLLDKDEEDRARREGDRPQPAATVYTVKNEQGEARHFRIVEGRAVACDTWEAGFGSMLLEPHPTRRIDVWGRMVAPHRYSCCWAPIECYRPLTAEQLAALRVSREAKKAERERQQWIKDNPLLALIEPPEG